MIFSKQLILGLATASIIPAISLASQSKRYVVMDRDLDRIEGMIQQYGGSVQKRLHYHQALVSQMKSSVKNQIEKDFPGVKIEEDSEVHLMGVKVSGKPTPGSTQPPQVIPWGIAKVQAPLANQTSRGAGVTVCVVDTGIQASHPDLSGQVIGGENFVVIKGIINPDQWADDNGHGTHVSGTIAALDNSIGVVGVAPDAKLFAVKVLNSRGSGYLSDVAEGITSCVNNGAKVISMSLGGSSGSELLHNSIIDAQNRGAIIVAAAGNESGAVSYPAAYPETLAISAVASDLSFASFSNFGPEVDYAAPGVSVLSTVKGSTYATYSGTSMATPHASGVVALMISSGSLGLMTQDIGLSAEQQGLGFLRADLTVNNF